MTQRLQQENRLLVLKLSLSLTSEATQVVFDLSYAGEPVGRLAAAPEEVGVPMTLDEANAADRDPGRFRLPDHVITSVEAMVRQMLTEGEPLWLHIDYPCGHLPLVPWERLLQPRLGVPVLRLPNLDIQPVTPRESLDTVICISLPAARRRISNEAIIDRLVRQIPPDLAQHTNFHLFADQAAQPGLRRLCDAFGSEYRITLYDPATAPSYAEAYTRNPESSASELENPWLIWMLNALRGRSADVVHFLCHGYLGRDKGKLALAQAPLRDVEADWARLVDAQQLSTFLNRIGAWSVAFSSPPGNASPSGLRLLQEQLSRLRPGPVLLHDMDQDGDGKPLEDCYRFLYAPEAGAAPRSAAVSLHCHPLQLARQQSDPVAQRILDEFTLSETMSEMLRGPQNTPGWIAGSQRSLEQAAAGLSRELTSDVDKAIRSGTESALRFTSQLLAKAASLGKGKS